MTRQDYRLIANCLSESRPSEESQCFNARYETWANTRQEISNMLYKDNPAFNKAKFFLPVSTNHQLLETLRKALRGLFAFPRAASRHSHFRDITFQK